MEKLKTVYLVLETIALAYMVYTVLQLQKKVINLEQEIYDVKNNSCYHNKKRNTIPEFLKIIIRKAFNDDDVQELSLEE